MAKFRIAQNPTFKSDVDIPRVGGKAQAVEFEFKYRDREELAELFASWNKAAKDEQERLKDLGDDITLVDLTLADIDRQVAQVTELIVGWSFDDKLSPESIRALVKTSAGAADAILKAYQAAFAVARLGN
jgi:hypothetical protein